jgi:hypothetical protein
LQKKLFEQTLPQHKQIGSGPIVDLTDREDIANFYRSLREQIEDEFSIDKFTADREHFDKLDDDDKVKEILICLQHFGELGEAVFVKAARGLFEDLGLLKPWLISLIKSLETLPRVRLVLLSTRQPSLAQLSELPNIFWLHVPPLEDEAIATLLRMELAQEGITDFDPDREALLTIGGHPAVARSLVGRVVQQGGYVIERLRSGLFRVQDILLSRNLNYDD